SLINGALFMLFFGVGTFSIMLTLPLFGNLIGKRFKHGMQKISPAFKVGMAALLILRGLNLGIPYISPEMNEHNVIVCHDDETSAKSHPLILCAKPKTVIKSSSNKP
ncbi:MAG: sulfite exporter TauE/SafE family protein, partial [Bacteroidota bacterium]